MRGNRFWTGVGFVGRGMIEQERELAWAYAPVIVIIELFCCSSSAIPSFFTSLTPQRKAVR